MAPRNINRRDFVADTTKLALGAMVVPRHVLGGPGYRAPSSTLNVAIIGAGGQGMSNGEQLVAENIVALCDVDFGYVDRQLASRPERGRDGGPRPMVTQLKEKFPKAARYADYREMLEKQKDIQAVVIATPDHSHAVIAKAAMELGKHVYVQKPLTYSVHEARVLAETARRTNVVAGMGNQGHSWDGTRSIHDWMQAGVLGAVREVHVWTNRPIWPQGIPRPTAPPAPPAPGATPPAAPGWGTRAINDRLGRAMWGDYPTPEGLNWDLYLGPVPEVAYHPVYHPFNWRGWVDFGVGALGDMGAHLIDQAYWSLGLTFPTSIEATSTPWGGPRDRPASYPLAMTVHYEFPARGSQPPVRLYWYDGGLMPPRHEVLPDDVVLNREGGAMFVGEKGILIHDTYGENPRLYPDSLTAVAQAAPKKMPRIAVSHEINWAMACKGEAEVSCPMEYAARLTEVMLLGIVALRTGQGRKINYDAQNMRVTNVAEANQYLTRDYRPGWTV